MQERRSIADRVGQDFFDDPDAKLGLRAGEKDSKGRTIATLPERDAYRPELDGKSPQEMAEILAREDQQREDADANNVEALMKEAPGGRPKRGGSRSGKRHRRKSSGGSTGGLDETTIAGGTASDDGRDEAYRPIVVSGRVSIQASESIKRACERDRVSLGEMIEDLGVPFAAGASWSEVRDALHAVAAIVIQRVRVA